MHYFRTCLVLRAASPAGDVQIGLMDKKGQLEVEVIRARGLTPKPGSKSLPGTTQTPQLNFKHVRLLLFLMLPSFLPQLPMSKCTCWITVHVKPKRKPRLRERPWSLSTSSTCSLMRVLRARCFRYPAEAELLHFSNPFLCDGFHACVLQHVECVSLPSLTLNGNFSDSNNCFPQTVAE